VDLILLLWNSKRRLQNTDVSTMHYKAVTLIKKQDATLSLRRPRDAPNI